MDVFRDSTKSVKTRVKGLLSGMTLEEKISQLGSIFSSALLEDGKFILEKAEGLLSNGIGQISAIGRTSGLPPREFAAEEAKLIKAHPLK